MLCGWSLLHVARTPLAPRILASVLLVRGSILQPKVRFASLLTRAATPAAASGAARERTQLHGRTNTNEQLSSAPLLRQSEAPPLRTHPPTASFRHALLTGSGIVE